MAHKEPGSQKGQKEDARKRSRHSIQRRVFLQADGAEVAGSSVIMDMHEAGAFISAPEGEAVKVGARVQMVFRLPHRAGYEHVLAHGTVRWRGQSVTHSSSGFGVEFDRPLGVIQACIENFKRQHQPA